VLIFDKDRICDIKAVVGTINEKRSCTGRSVSNKVALRDSDSNFGCVQIIGNTARLARKVGVGGDFCSAAEIWEIDTVITPRQTAVCVVVALVGGAGTALVGEVFIRLGLGRTERDGRQPNIRVAAVAALASQKVGVRWIGRSGGEARGEAHSLEAADEGVKVDRGKVGASTLNDEGGSDLCGLRRIRIGDDRTVAVRTDSIENTVHDTDTAAAIGESDTFIDNVVLKLTRGGHLSGGKSKAILVFAMVEQIGKEKIAADKISKRAAISFNAATLRCSSEVSVRFGVDKTPFANSLPLNYNAHK
jgi:hypothetical protein